MREDKWEKEKTSTHKQQPEKAKWGGKAVQLPCENGVPPALRMPSPEHHRNWQWIQDVCRSVRTPFKTRYPYHMSILRNERYCSSTGLSKYMWDWKSKDQTFCKKWRMKDRAQSHSNASKKGCNLRLTEKFRIITADQWTSVNIRSSYQNAGMPASTFSAISGQHHVTGSIEKVQPRLEWFSDQLACINTSAFGPHMQ